MSVKLVSLIDQWVALISFYRLEFIEVISRLIKTIIIIAAATIATIYSLLIE
jgi:hypothetical protein